MDIKLLKKIGLTDSQAKSYSVLVEHGNLSPPQLAKKTGESRTAAYMALAKLEEIGLASQDKKAKKQIYRPTSPSNLDKYLENKRQDLRKVEESYRAGIADLLATYYEQQNQPGVRYFRGKEGLRSMYEEHLKTGKDVYLLRTYADEPFFEDYLYEYLFQRAELGIKTYSLMPFDISSYSWNKKNKLKLNREVTWYPPAAYTAPVEISSFGNKVSIISFGNEAVGTILESPQIAQAIKQLIGLAQTGAQELMKQDKFKTSKSSN